MRKRCKRRIRSTGGQAATPDGYLTPLHHYLALKNSTRPFTEDEKQAVLAPLRGFAVAVQEQRATEDDWKGFLSIAHATMCLNDVLLRLPRVSADDDQNLLIKLLLEERGRWAMGNLKDLVESVHTRFQTLGRFGMTGDDHRRLEAVLDVVQEMLSVCGVCHWIQACDESSAVLHPTYHQPRKCKHV